jgi:hypothetical protein
MRTVDIFSTCSQEVLLGFLTYIFFLGHKEFSVRLFKDNLLKCIFEMRYYWFRYGKMLFDYSPSNAIKCITYGKALFSAYSTRLKLRFSLFHTLFIYVSIAFVIPWGILFHKVFWCLFEGFLLVYFSFFDRFI